MPNHARITPIMGQDRLSFLHSLRISYPFSYSHSLYASVRGASLTHSLEPYSLTSLTASNRHDPIQARGLPDNNIFLCHLSFSAFFLFYLVFAFCFEQVISFVVPPYQPFALRVAYCGASYLL
ncbi:hypothetical protein BJ508DRAFT_38689 [Ascobolus immersus RN42]|uniref:Uncharacterized protein n=1 Tax=Ascobolus immersus RN42 TaxID=1160509 RepID=A0A3N4IFB3_ASCIM|nr:hypothetical protein BJ508DRAFT_38689 [Ascobolus immersus RN42]